MWGWSAVALSVVVAILSGWADHRRVSRDNLDRIGIIDWRTVQLVAIATAIIGASVALNG